MLILKQSCRRPPARHAEERWWNARDASPGAQGGMWSTPRALGAPSESFWLSLLAMNKGCMTVEVWNAARCPTMPTTVCEPWTGGVRR